MTISAIVLSAAKQVGISGQLLLAICSVESNLNPKAYVHEDGGSPSIGLCQMKRSTAKLFVRNITEKQLLDAYTNAFVAAKYIKYQQDRYGNDWHKLATSFNAGRFNESSKVPGCGRNLRYSTVVRSKLPKNLQHRMDCKK